MSSNTFHTTAEDIRKAESKASNAHGGNVPKDSDVSAMKVNFLGPTIPSRPQLTLAIVCHREQPEQAGRYRPDQGQPSSSRPASQAQRLELRRPANSQRWFRSHGGPRLV